MKDPILAIPDEAQKNHLFLAGTTGSGKTTTGRGIIEYNLWAGRRVCIIDPNDDWYGLKSSADGTKAAFPVIVFGGEHGDVAIDETMGAKIGELIATTNTPAVICLKEFSPERTTKFLTPFFEALFRLNKQVLHLVLDEAHRYIPQQPRPDQAKLIHRVTDMVTGGRSRGFKFLIITQRPARIHKDPIAMCKTFILHETTSSHDRKALKDMLDEGGNDEVRNKIIGSLPSLQPGHAWLWIPRMKILEEKTFPKGQTFDSGAAPDDGETKSEPTKLAFVDLDAIKALLAPKARAAKPSDSTPSGAGAEADRRQRAYQSGYDTAKEEGLKDLAAQRRAYEKTIADMRKEWTTTLATLRKTFQHLATATKGAADVAADLMAKFPEVPAAAPPQAAVATLPIAHVVRAPRPPSLAIADRDDISNTERKFLNAVRFWADLGYDAPTREQVAAVAGYPVSSGSTKNSLGSLTSKGLTHYPTQGQVSLTDAGAAIAESPGIEPTTAGIRQAIDRVLDKPMRLFLDAAIANYPHEMSRDEAATFAGYPVSSGSTKNALGALRSLEAITYPSQGFIKAADWFFPGEQ